MRLAPRVVGVLAVAALAGGSLVAGAGVAQAAGTPFDPTGNGSVAGAVSFYDASGLQVTSGALSSPPSYALASTWTGRTTAAGHTNLATLYAATPVKGQNPLTWPNEQVSVASLYPDGAAPAGLKGNPHVLAAQIFEWFDAAGYPGNFPNTNSDAAWQNLYQLRLEDSGPGIPVDPQSFASATIQIDTVAGTWTQVYPDPNALPPSVTSAAAVTGTAKVGSKVTCAVSFDTADSIAYMWQRDGKNIKGATSPKYVLASSDYNHKVGCVATGTNVNGDTVSKSPTKKVALGPALKSTKAPTISGTAKVGKTLTCKAGAWTPKATSYGYQWKRNGKAIKGAKKNKYKLTAKDKGKKISCTVTAKRAGYANGVKTSKAKKVK